MDLIASLFTKQDSETLHQTLRAYDAIITELTDGPNVQKAKNQIQSAVKAIEHLIQDDQNDWAVEGFQMFQEIDQNLVLGLLRKFWYLGYSDPVFFLSVR